MKKTVFILLFAASLFLSPALALFAGIIFALTLRSPYPKFTRSASKYMLQASVVGLGFGMNLHESLKASSDGMLMTIASVTGILILGYFLGRLLKIDSKLAHLIASGTAICGGSAIAAISPITRADDNQTSMSLAVIFTLNAIALFIFPPLGHMLGLSQEQFGLWSAIAIHDTSSVVGAGSAYGEQALMVATTVKLTRALWIIPVALASILFFPVEEGTRRKITIPWFIFMFIAAMIINTYLPINPAVTKGISIVSHKTLSATLFLIGSTLSVSAIKEVGIKPVILGISLWIAISLITILVIM